MLFTNIYSCNRYLCAKKLTKKQAEILQFSKLIFLFDHGLANGNGDNDALQRRFILSKKRLKMEWT